MGHMKRQERYEAEQRERLARGLRVLMQFESYRNGWRVTFRAPSSQVPLPRVVTFIDPDKIKSLFRRYGVRRMSEDMAALEYGIQQRRGIVELVLGPEQYAMLQMEKTPPRRVRP